MFLELLAKICENSHNRWYARSVHCTLCMDDNFFKVFKLLKLTKNHFVQLWFFCPVETLRSDSSKKKNCPQLLKSISILGRVRYFNLYPSVYSLVPWNTFNVKNKALRLFIHLDIIRYTFKTFSVLYYDWL